MKKNVSTVIDILFTVLKSYYLRAGDALFYLMLNPLYISQNKLETASLVNHEFIL